MKDENKQIIIDEAGNKNNCEKQFSTKSITKVKIKGSLSNLSEETDKKPKSKKTLESDSSAEEKNVEIEFNENDDTIAIEEQIKETIIHDTSQKNIQIVKEVEESSKIKDDCNTNQHERKNTGVNDINEKDKNEGDNYYKPVRLRKIEGKFIFENRQYDIE